MNIKRHHKGGDEHRKIVRDISTDNLNQANKEAAAKAEPKKQEETANVIKWEAPEYEYEPKTVSWYWLSIIISIILIAIALWQKNFLFVVFIVIAELVLIYFSNLLPKVWSFEIDDEGISIISNSGASQKKKYPFSDVLGFDIYPANDGYKELIIHTNLKLTPYVKMFIFAEDEKKIEEKLLEVTQREEIPHLITDALEKIVRF